MIAWAVVALFLCRAVPCRAAVVVLWRGSRKAGWAGVWPGFNVGGHAFGVTALRVLVQDRWLRDSALRASNMLAIPWPQARGNLSLPARLRRQQGAPPDTGPALFRLARGVRRPLARSAMTMWRGRCHDKALACCPPGKIRPPNGTRSQHLTADAPAPASSPPLPPTAPPAPRSAASSGPAASPPGSPARCHRSAPRPRR